MAEVVGLLALSWRMMGFYIGLGIDFDICPWSYRPVSEPLFWLLIPNPHWPCWSKKWKHNYQKKASSRNAIRSITFMNYVMEACTILRYISRWAGVLLQHLNKIDIDNTSGTHPDTFHIMTAPVIRREACAFPHASLSPYLRSAIRYEVMINISHVSHG